jgi:hypothetical protein
MTLGFVIIRHVNSKITDYYWKECYTCIRKIYDNPIMIIDDSSNKEFLNENILLQNCTVIYDTQHKGAAELLPYYYFHLLKPFDTAVIIHDSVFIQSKINFELNENENCRMLWSFGHMYDNELLSLIQHLCTDLLEDYELQNFFYQTSQWRGCFGVMSVIKWEFLNKIEQRHLIFQNFLKKVNHRECRSALERVWAMIIHYNDPNIRAEFGDIYSFIQWGVTFSDYITKDYSRYPLLKVWSGR